MEIALLPLANVVKDPLQALREDEEAIPDVRWKRMEMSKDVRLFTKLSTGPSFDLVSNQNGKYLEPQTTIYK